MKLQRTFSFFIISFLVGALAFPSVSFGIMSSTNYTIFADSIDSGGALSTSGTYSLEDSIGESPVGSIVSSTYEILGGYQAMDWGGLALELDTTNINLGNLTTSAVASSTAVASVTAAAASGYVLSVGAVGGTSLAGVTDGVVTAGQEEYGVAVSGSDVAFFDDREIIGGLNLASSSTPVTNAPTNLTFKAAISASTATGARSQSITLTASANI